MSAFKSSVLALGLLLVAPLSGSSAWPPKVEPDKNSILAARLLGKWQLQEPLSLRLMGKSKHKVKGLAITADRGVAARIPAKYQPFLDGKRIYLAGQLQLNGKVSYPFVLIARGGSGHIVFFRARNGDPMGDAESFYVMLAQAREPTKDLLFLGGDMPGEPFMALERSAP